MIALDTTAMIDLWKADPRVRDAIAVQGARVCTTSINYQELVFGLDPHNGKHRQELDFYQRLTENMIVLDHKVESAEHAGRIWWTLQKKGHMIGEFDVMISGVLLEHGVTKILTRNAKHFARVPGLRTVVY